jgi:glycosyltransferase involved in cell wall biosynthesis
MRPAITHVVPVYNGAAYLRETLDSLLPELAPGDEVIVSDDGSTDDSVAIAEAWGRARVLRGRNQGAPAARNRAIAVAKGSWICLLDADDLALPDRVARLGARLLADDRPDLVYGGQRRFLSPHLIPSGAPPPPEIDEAPAPLPSCLFGTRAAFARVGPFDETLRVGELVPWWGRALALGLRTVAVPGAVIRRRRHDHNISNAADYRKFMVEAVHQNLLRKRREITP